MNDKLFKRILIGIGSLVLIGYGLVYYFHLDEPVFLQHDYELQLTEEDDHNEIPFNLNYITNSDEERVVIGIMFPEYPDLFVQASESHFTRPDGFYWDQPFDDGVGTAYGRYTLRTIYVNMLDLEGVDDVNDFSLTKVTLYFNDSTEMTVDVGEVRLYTEEEDDQLVEQLYGDRSTDGRIEATYRIYEDLLLSSLEQDHAFSDSTTQIKINEVDYSDADELRLDKNDIVSISTTGEPSGDSIEDFKVSNYFPKLTLTTTDGDEINPRFPHINRHDPRYSFNTIYRYLRARGEI